MRHSFFVLTFAGLVVFGGGIAALLSPVTPAIVTQSVEVGLSEFSPLGEAGGYAIPASGSSYNCTLPGMPGTMSQGQTWSVAYTPYTMNMAVYRNGIYVGTGSNGWFTDAGSSSLSPGVYTYSLSGSLLAGEHCTNWGSYCSGDPKTGVYCSSECTAWGSFYDDYSCSGTLTVAATVADLVSSALAIQGGATTMTQNQSYVLTATVTNSGSTAAGAFSDSFAFGYGGSGGSFTQISTTSKASLAAAAASADTSASFAPASAGTITIRHCVDSASQVTESNEANNCTYRNYTVAGAIVASCSVSPTSVEEDDNVTWTASASGGTPGYSYSWSGTDSLSGSGTSTVKSYINSGTKTGSVTVTDSLGISSGVTSCSLPVLSVSDNDPVADIKARALGSGAAWSDGPLTISALQEVELRWDSTNATSCTGDTNYSTGGADEGTTAVVAEAPGGQSRTYTVTCSKSGDSDQDTVQVDRDVPVSPPTITANPDRVRQGETATITGNLNGHTGCAITGGNTNITVPDGTTSFSYTSAAILGETTLTLECALGEDSDIVYILPSVQHI